MLRNRLHKKRDPQSNDALVLVLQRALPLGEGGFHIRFNRGEYEFPGEGCEAITDCFMLGDALLVAPILQPGQTERRVYVPRGMWQTPQGPMQSAGEWHVFAAENCLPIVLRRSKENA